MTRKGFLSPRERRGGPTKATRYTAQITTPQKKKKKHSDEFPFSFGGSRYRTGEARPLYITIKERPPFFLPFLFPLWRVKKHTRKRHGKGAGGPFDSALSLSLCLRKHSPPMKDHGWATPVPTRKQFFPNESGPSKSTSHACMGQTF